MILISVSIANYAISASYLGRETRLTRGRMEKRKQRLNEAVKELQAKGLSIGELKKETKEAEDDIKGLGSRLFFLSWVGAVILPSICFIASLVGVGIGMNSDIFFTNSQTPNTLVYGLMNMSTSFLAVGFSFLLVVIGVIDSAARKFPLPELEVYFENKTKTIRIKRNKRTALALCLRNKGEDVAEDMEIFHHFPPVFKVEEFEPYYKVIKQLDIKEIDFPNYVSAKVHDNLLHVDVTDVYEIMIVTPDEAKTYEIPVYIYERKIGLIKDKLIIQTTD